MKLYVVVSNDNLELPELVCTNMGEVARKLGISYNSAKQCFSKSKNPKYKNDTYIRRFKIVEIDDE